jgi:hypothetical protein
MKSRLNDAHTLKLSVVMKGRCVMLGVMMHSSRLQLIIVVVPSLRQKRHDPE